VLTNMYPPVVRGGYEMLCEDVVSVLRERGHDVLVLTSDLEAERHRGSDWIRPLLPFVPHSRAARMKAPLDSIRAARATRAALAGHRPEVVSVWNMTHVPRTSLRIAQLEGPPLVVNVSEWWVGRSYPTDPFIRYLLPEPQGPRWPWALLCRAVNRHPALRLDVTSDAPMTFVWHADALRRLTPLPRGIVAAREEVVHPASRQAESFRTDGERPPPDGEPMLLFVGRVVPEKGVDVAIRALARLRDAHGIAARLVVAGGVEHRLRSDLDRLARDLGVSAAVEFAGMRSREEIGDLLRRASALVVPSQWQEPTGNVLFEGALARVPIVAARSGGMPEMLRPDEHAMFFGIGTVGACADALARTLTATEETRARVERAFARASSFTVEGFADAVERVLEEAAAQRPGAGVTGAR
jgi:glycogen synthase